VQIYGKYFILPKLLHKKIKKIIFVPMKRLAKIFVIALFTFVYGEIEAKNFFEKNSHDFGTIAEESGVVEHQFTLRNILQQPLVIVSTYSSCGCTKAEFSRKPIMPDSTTTIKVTFNPMNYPGVFARKVTIVTNDGVLKEQLLVTGTVIPREKSIEERYPIIMGEGVRAATNAHSFGYLEHGKSKQSAFEIINTSKRKVSLRIENQFSELEFYYPEELAAGEKTMINFSCLLPESSTVYGSLAYSVSLVVNGRKSQYPFIINGLAIDSRNENANNSPQMIALSENFIKFGAVKCNTKDIVRALVVRNDGAKPIIIRKLELDEKGFLAEMKGEATIAPGEKRVIEVTITPSLLPFGAVVERLRIVSNDPKMPVYTVRVSAIVER
jgi:LEA14-like dessication related protein